ncbi:hypothetical protein SNE40_021258 [Patella caerulea]|uniref:Uncharacterized protein n=1 Tax=Patella caerulea TaxID=87958 RepID=A0AAN8J0H6_PATCE
MNTPATLAEIQNTINKLETPSNPQKEIQEGYNDIIQTLTKEMNIRIPSKTTHANKRHQRNNKVKPYWNSDLKLIWDKACEAKKRWLKEYSHVLKRQLRADFCDKRRTFDKYHRKIKRKYNNDKRIEFEQTLDNNHVDFWKTIGRIGIGNDRKQTIPMESTRL